MQVGGHDRVQAFGLQGHAHGHCIDQHLVPCHVREFARDLGCDFIPHHHAMALGVGFRDHRQQLAGPRPGQCKGIAHDPRHTHAGENCRLGCHLLRQPAMCPPAMARIFAFRVLAHNDPIQIARTLAAQGRFDPGQDARGAHIGVLIKALADWQAQTPQRDMIRYIRCPDRAKVNRVKRFELRQPVLGHHHAMGPVVIRPPLKPRDVQVEPAVTGGQRIQHLQPGFDHLRSDPVRADGGNPQRGQRPSPNLCTLEP